MDSTAFALLDFDLVPGFRVPAELAAALLAGAGLSRVAALAVFAPDLLPSDALALPGLGAPDVRVPAALPSRALAGAAAFRVVSA